MAINGVNLDKDFGLSILSFNEVRQNLAKEFTTIFGDKLNTESSSPDGMLIDIFAYAYTEVAQALQGAVAGLNVATAEGISLDNLGKIMGLPRNDGESDGDYRIRLNGADLTGLATLDGMRTYMQSKVGSGVSVVENCEDEVVNGVPAHCVAVYVSNAYDEVTDDTIAQAIWECKPAGIRAVGTSSGTAKDKAGFVHEIQFSRISSIPMAVSVTIRQYDEESLPEDFESAIKKALVAWAVDEYAPGKDVIIQRMYSPVFSVPGIENVSIIAEIGGVRKDSGKFPIPDSEFVSIDEDSVTVVLEA